MSLASKLQIKSGRKALLIGAPKSVAFSMTPPEGASIVTRGGGPFDVVIAFVASAAEVITTFRRAHAAIADDGILWLCYPKKSGGGSNDLTRDHGWEPVTRAGFAPVSQIAIDDTWSALRFKHDPSLIAMRAQRKKPDEKPTLNLRTRVSGSRPAPAVDRTEKPTVSIRVPRRSSPPPPRRSQRPTVSLKAAGAPPDLAAAIVKSPDAARRWSELPPRHRKEHVAYVDEVKRADARARRIEKTVETLESEDE
jgi:hypothetical protein